MIVKNWMSKNPDTMSSDLSAKDAINLFEEHRVPFMSVVDNGKFRGLIARRDLREAAAWAIATQDIYEIQYFNERLKVKDIMVRKPITLSVNDTVETALEKGKKFGRSFLPVMDGDTLVGTLSNRDFTYALSQLLGGDENLHGVSIEINGETRVTIRKILEEIFMMGLQIQGLFTLKDPDSGVKRLTIRFEAKCFKRITSLIEEKGYKLLEVVKHER
ncbi:MAG: CBS domain-containing protein [Desulfobacula sp.]|nr:CBS domain-containing protein [Desulfobacula sp.]MCK5350873.1 CBS domain-containing protein [Desulfobacula sp.]